MATRRSSFRFRLPWSQDEPASQPSTRPNASTAPSPATPLAAGSKPAAPATSTINLSTVETPTSNQPPDPTENTTPGILTSPTQAGIKKINQHPNNNTNSPRPIEPSSTSTSVTPATATTGETQIPIQPSNMNSTSANSPARSTSQTTTSNAATSKISQRPPFRPAGAGLSPKNRASRNESQSSSPPQATNKSSPAPQATNKFRISPPPASPSDTATKSRLSQFPSSSRSTPQSPALTPTSSPFPSSSRSTPQSPALTPTSSPARKAPQVLSTKASQESSDSPSVVKTQMQEENQAATLPTSVLKSLQEISGPSSKSTQVRSPILDKKEQMELQTKKATMSDAVSEAKVSFTDKTMQPSEASILKSTMTGTTEGPSEKSHSSSITGESKMVEESASTIQETKEVVHETRGKDYGAGEKSRQVQSKQAYIVKQEEATKDHSLVNPVSNGRQTRASASQTRNKTIFTGSSQKIAVSNEPHIPLHREIKDNISKVFNRVAVGDGKQENGKIPVNVITLAGDNRGASMQLGSDSSTKGGRIHIHREYKINPDESADATTDGEGSSKRRRSKDARAMEDQTVAAYVNCNAQGINNSISYNSSITERNPGVHMSIPRVPEKTGLFEAHKAEFSVTPARTIRRRCLRGLFLESSDSDPDTPEKPRRHGCRVGCNDKKKIAR